MIPQNWFNLEVTSRPWFLRSYQQISFKYPNEQDIMKIVVFLKRETKNTRRILREELTVCEGSWCDWLLAVLPTLSSVLFLEKRTIERIAAVKSRYGRLRVRRELLEDRGPIDGVAFTKHSVSFLFRSLVFFLDSCIESVARSMNVR